MQLTVGRCADLTSQLEVYERNKDRAVRRPDGVWLLLRGAGGQLLYVPPVSGAGRRGLLQKATELDLFLVPGTAFGCPGHFRLAYCVPEERVVAALPRFKQLAERYQRQKD